MKYITFFKDIRIDDISSVGGKTASIGQMIAALVPKGIRIPDGFAVTASAYWHYIDHNNLRDFIKETLEPVTSDSDITQLARVGKAIRSAIIAGSLPLDLQKEIRAAYHDLSSEYNVTNCDVAVRSSATAEDLPGASFAGQQETYLNVTGEDELLKRCKECFASLFTDRAIMYRLDKGFDHLEVALSVAVQKMVRSDTGASGVAFSLDTESGFSDVVLINSSYGLGEAIVQGEVIPDEFLVYKPTLEKGYAPILKKTLGSKEIKMVYSDPGDTDTLIKSVPVTKSDRCCFSIDDAAILEIARAVALIEEYYSSLNNAWTPMDVEWAQDGQDGLIYIVQARPETIYGSDENRLTLSEYTLKPEHDKKPVVLVSGQSIGQHIVTGVARVISSIDDIKKVKEGDLIVTRMTDPDWVPAMKKAVGIITEQGGRTCHAAIVSRELGIPALVGAHDAMSRIADKQKVTLDCSQGKTGYVYQGYIPYTKDTVAVKHLPPSPIPLMINLADPDRAFRFASLPIDGVGLARIEFIINNFVKIHPMALLYPDRVVNEKERERIDIITSAYDSSVDFFVDTLAQGIATIAAVVYPKPAIVRFSDFKSNEYRNLIGGSFFEPEEENPMIGFRGASRYYDERYRAAFDLECQAIKKVRNDMGLVNVQVMVPFVRTVAEAQKVLKIMKENGLERGKDGLQVVMMCEIPANVILIDEFLNYFDGISIGSNDLTQLALGVDRDSALLSTQFDERDPAVMALIEMAINGARRHGKKSGICGQAPSDYPELANFVINLGIDSISLNPDSVIPFLMRLKK